MSKFLLLLILFVFSACNGRVNSEQQVASFKLQHEYDDACTAGKCPCASPLGPIVDGGTAVAYDTSNVACGQTCSSHTVPLLCTNGKFNRDITKLNFSCGVASCKACNVGNNQVPHGFTVVAYNTTTVGCGASCDDTKRALVCNDGALQGGASAPSADGLDANYKYGACAPSSCNCALPTGGALTLGGSLKFYKSSAGTCDATCDAVGNTLNRACVNTGTNAAPVLGLNGDATFASLACTGPSAAACDCVLPDAAKTTLHHGQSQALFASTTQVNCTACASVQIMAYCGSGILYDKAITDTTKKVLTPSQLTSHTNITCDQSLTKDCSINNICIANAGSQKLYGKSTLVCGDDLNALTSTFSCTNKVLAQNGGTYTAGTDANAATWQVSPPTNSCIGCVTPWKAAVPKDAKVTAYKSSSASSNTCGGGCKSLELTCTVVGAAPSGVFKTGDTSIDADLIANPASYTQSCTNTCTEEGGGAPPRACLLPWQNSFVTPDTLIPMYSARSVICGDSCQNHFKVGRCLMSTGNFDAGTPFIYQSCTEVPCGTLKVTAVTPSFRTTSGGVITLTGTGFAAGMTVKIGSLTCGSVNVVSATSATCTVPAGSGLYQDIVVQASSLKAMLPRSFSFYTGTCTAGPGSQTFKFSYNSVQSFTVPAGCTNIGAQVWGAGGGGHFSTTVKNTQFGGSGGYSTGIITVTPAQTLFMAVGGGGGYYSYYSPGGGGYSGVFSSQTMNASTALIMAGGGGGAGDPNGCNIGSTGGEGGGTVGGTHGGCSGKGGSQTAGGAAGTGATAGVAFAGAMAGPGGFPAGGYFGGGSAGSSNTGGGGGGGGFFGGGSGSETSGLGGAGGGGSGYLAPSITSGTLLGGTGSKPAGINDPNYISGVALGGGLSAGGNGMIVISW